MTFTKKNPVLFFCAGLLLALSATIMLWSCSGSGNKKSASVRIGLSLPTQREERWVKDRRTMEEYARKKGVELLVQVTDTDARLQANQVENLLTQGIHILILAPHDS